MDAVSGDRLRHELFRVLEEVYPEKALRRAYELGALHRLHPSFKDNGWLRQRFEYARDMDSPTAGLYLALLTWRLSAIDTEDFISRLRFPKTMALVIRDTSAIKKQLGQLAKAGLAPSRVYRLLHGRSPLAITANMLASDSPAAQQCIRLYLDRLRYVKPVLNGNDLVEIGLPTGPRISEVLRLLLEARLDGMVHNKQDEVEVVKEML